MAKIRIELEIEARPYSDEEYAAEMMDSGYEAGLDDEPDEIDADGIASCLAAQFYDGSDMVNEMMAGSNMFVKFGKAMVIRAEEVA